MLRKTFVLTGLTALLSNISLFAQEVKKSPPTFWDFFLSAKYLIGIELAIIGVLLIWQRKLDNKIRIPFMIVAFLSFGAVFGLHPSPVCMITKPFIYGLAAPFLAGIIFLLVLSIFVTKGYCGTICPAGALQEIFYKIPVFKKLKPKTKVPFVIANSIRTILVAAFIIVLLTAGATIYEYVNLFELFHWDGLFAGWPEGIVPITLITFGILLAVTLALSLFLYRPYCYFICPVGWVTWLLEQGAPARVRLNKSACTECDECVDKSPCLAIKDIKDQKKFTADCFLCGECIESCEDKALYFGVKNKNK